MKKATRIVCLAMALLLALTAPALAFEGLAKGSKGDAVVELQNKLNELGYSVGTADGDFGGKTEKAIKQFQRDKGLKVTGKLDEETYNELLNAAKMFDIFPCSVGDLIILTADKTATMVEEDRGELYYETVGTDVVSIIKDGGEYPMLLHSDGSVSLVYDECEFKLNDEWKDLTLAGASWTHAVGLKKDGTWIVTGANDSGQCNVSEWTDIVQIQVVDHYTIGLKSDGTVVSVGDTDGIDVSNWTDIVKIVGSGSIMGLKKDGTVVVTGSSEKTAQTVGFWKNIVDISANNLGRYFGLTADGIIRRSSFDGMYNYVEKNIPDYIQYDNAVGIHANTCLLQVTMEDGSYELLGYEAELYNDYLNHTGTAQHISNKKETEPMTNEQWAAFLDAFKGLESVDTNGDGQLSMDEIFK